MQETQVRSLGWDDPLEKEMATHSSILAWRILCSEEPGGLQSMGSQGARHDWATEHISIFPICYSEAREGMAIRYNLAVCVRCHVWLFSDLVDCSLTGSSVHGILPARVLKQVAISFSRGSSWPRDQTHVSCTAGRFFTFWATWEAQRYSHTTQVKEWGVVCRNESYQPWTMSFSCNVLILSGFY